MLVLTRFSHCDAYVNDTRSGLLVIRYIYNHNSFRDPQKNTVYIKDDDTLLELEPRTYIGTHFERLQQ